ncbi:MAG: ABC transporter ATP-binding protein/permease [Bacteroidales bacterium]|nr:ABC transporter ATP-binding protein/permease [Bacteroidales bacterium]
MKKLWQALMLVRRCNRRSFRLRVLYVVLQSVLPLVNLYILKLLVDAVTAAATHSVSPVAIQPLMLLAAMVTVFMLNRIVSALNAVNNDVLGQRLVDYMADIMQRQAARLDMAYYDNPAYYDSLHRAQQEASSRPLVILGNFMSLFGSLLSIAGIVVMLASASWLVIVVMVLAVIPGFAVRLYKARRIYRFRRDNTQLYRRTGYYSSLLSSRAYAAEMRAYNLTDFFRRRFVDSRSRLVGQLLRISRRFGTLDVLSSIIEAVAMFAIVWLLIQQAFAAAISVGTFVMLFEAFRRGQGYLSSLVSSIAALYDNRLFVGNLFDFLDFEPQIVSPANPVPMPEKIEVVEFRDITFRYQDMEHDVLHHYNLTAKVGEVTRIEGENGYGKSTLVKLLLRLYDPQEGTVLINGIDIRSFSLDELRRKVGVMFQDFGRYSLTAEENIAFSAPADITRAIERSGNQAIRNAAHFAGADTFIERLPAAYNNMLGRTFDGGAELSMGQWQRLAFARMLYTDAPVMVLDEPVAWIDIAARERFNAVIEQIKHDKIILIISHA